MAIHQRPSSNHGPRSASATIDMLILHYTGMTSAKAALDRMCDPASEVSAHYMVEEDGTTWQLVDEERRAWHAGRSYWEGERDLNSRSVGIELVNPGHEFGYRPFPEAQIAALEDLAQSILARRPIPPARVLGHSDIAPQRKEDPGELFPWQRLAANGIGRWPDFATPVAVDPSHEGVRRALARIGYDVGGGEAELRAVVTAFQRHWRPAWFDGVLDDETVRRIFALAAVS
jgi:N-acetylmuramoyl-L-alanine amidase